MAYRVQSNPIVNVSVTSSVTSLTSENRFNRDLTISALKCKLEMVTGAAASDMHIDVYTQDNKLVCDLSDNNALLGSYPVDSGMRLHVIDKRGKSLELEDVSKVEKYVMDDDAYAKKSNSVRAFKERMKVGRFKEVDPEEQARLDAEKRQLEAEEKQKAASIHVGDRCEVSVVGQPIRRGTVRYVGLPDFKPGHWVGIQYDEPLGKHNGSVEGKSYFVCPPKYGAFVRPNQITVGNFPELGFEDDDMEM